MKRLIVMFIVLLTPPASADIPHDWAKKDWTIQQGADGRVLYYTHGNEVDGNQLGFIKTKGSCSGDILWVSYISSDQKVTQFVNQAATLSFDIDGTKFKIDLAMLAVRSELLVNSMMFTSWLAGPGLIDMMIKGRKATLKITAPKALVDHLNTKQDTFSLIGFTAARRLAESICRGEPIKKKSTGAKRANPMSGTGLKK